MLRPLARDVGPPRGGVGSASSSRIPPVDKLRSNFTGISYPLAAGAAGGPPAANTFVTAPYNAQSVPPVAGAPGASGAPPRPLRGVADGGAPTDGSAGDAVLAAGVAPTRGAIGSSLPAGAPDPSKSSPGAAHAFAIDDPAYLDYVASAGVSQRTITGDSYWYRESEMTNMPNFLKGTVSESERRVLSEVPPPQTATATHVSSRNGNGSDRLDPSRPDSDWATKRTTSHSSGRISSGNPSEKKKVKARSYDGVGGGGSNDALSGVPTWHGFGGSGGNAAEAAVPPSVAVRDVAVAAADGAKTVTKAKDNESPQVFLARAADPHYAETAALDQHKMSGPKDGSDDVNRDRGGGTGENNPSGGEGGGSGVDFVPALRATTGESNVSALSDSVSRLSVTKGLDTSSKTEVIGLTLDLPGVAGVHRITTGDSSRIFLPRPFCDATGAAKWTSGSRDFLGDTVQNINGPSDGISASQGGSTPSKERSAAGEDAVAVGGSEKSAEASLAADPSFRAPSVNAQPAPGCGCNATGARRLTSGEHKLLVELGIEAPLEGTDPSEERGAAGEDAAAVAAAATGGTEKSAEASLAHDLLGGVPNDTSFPAPTVTLPYRAEDVLCVRGGLSNNHGGNIWYRKEASKRKQEYQNTSSTKRKNELRDEVIAAVHNRGGRFLKREKNTGRWVEVPLEGRNPPGVKKKVGQFLSENKTELS